MNALALERQGDEWRLVLDGDWSLAAMATIDRELENLDAPASGTMICDWSRAANPGIGPVWALLTRFSTSTAAIDPSSPAPRAARLRLVHVGAPNTLEFLQKLRVERHALRAASPTPRLDGALGGLGRWTLDQGIEVRGVVGFFGRIVAVLGESFQRPRALRPSSLVRHVYETGITAIPIVSLIAFLISVIVAYLGAQQLSRFGADIFVVDLVTISVLREMGVLLTAIIVAGRSGSAFAAEIGVMQLNEETDALRALGINPIEILVVPRILALAIALPLLTIIADAMGLAGGGLLSLLNLHIPLPQFTHRLREALAPTTFWAGSRQGADLRHSDRHSGGLSRHASARVSPRVGATDHGGRGAVHFHGHSRRRAVRHLVRANRFLMQQPTEPPIIRVRGLVNRFGAQVVHDGLDMEVRSNEIFGVVGGSGAGKSVLLRTILGLRSPDGGSVELYGQDMQHLSRAERSRLVRSYGVTFQNGALISSLTVAQNIQLPLREYFSMIEDTLDGLAELNLALVGLPPDAAGKYPSQLSGGMVKRAALARALSLEPKLLFLDEPTSGLDPISAAAFDELLLYLHSQLRLTVVMITHDLDTLFRTCSRVGVIVDRHMITDTLEGMLRNPHPWIHDYFLGPRARAVEKAADG